MPALAFDTNLGRCRVAWDEAGLTGFSLPGAESPRCPAAAADAAPAEAPAWIRGLIERVRRHLEGKPEDFTDVRLDAAGVSPFASRVYAAVRAIPAGKTCTYGELTAAIGASPKAARAVGAALGANRWPLIVPCHRIVGAGGRLTGFSAPGGVRAKARLLAIEGAQLISD